MAICCPVCGSEDVRPSRLREGDGYHILRFHYPIRCRSCRLRGWGSFYWVAKLWLRLRAEEKEAARNRNEGHATDASPHSKP
jgi:hypothetical protein